MSFNIMDLVKDQLSDKVMGSIGGLIGGNDEQASSAVGAAVPGLLSSFLHKGSTHEGATALFDTIKNQDDSLLDNMGDMLGGDKQHSMVESGSHALSSVLGGDALGGLSDAVSGASGISKGGAASMMGMLAPMLFGTIKKSLMGGSEGFSAGSLMNMLNGQKDNIQAAMPSDFADKLNFTGLDHVADKVQEHTHGKVEDVKEHIQEHIHEKAEHVQEHVKTNIHESVSEAKESVQEHIHEVKDNIHEHAQEHTQKSGSMFGKLLPLLLLAGLGYFAFTKFLGGGEATTTEPVTEPTPVHTEQAAPEVNVEELGTNLTGSIGSLMSGFGGIKDVESAKAALPDLESATNDFGKYSAILDKLPEGAKSTVLGLVGSKVGDLKGMLEKVTAIPGVGAIIKPIADTLLSKLSIFG
jgi:gas vesicle protein